MTSRDDYLVFLQDLFAHYIASKGKEIPQNRRQAQIQFERVSMALHILNRLRERHRSGKFDGRDEMALIAVIGDTYMTLSQHRGLAEASGIYDALESEIDWILSNIRRDSFPKEEQLILRAIGIKDADLFIEESLSECQNLRKQIELHQGKVDAALEEAQKEIAKMRTELDELKSKKTEKTTWRRRIGTWMDGSTRILGGLGASSGNFLAATGNLVLPEIGGVAMEPGFAFISISGGFAAIASGASTLVKGE